MSNASVGTGRDHTNEIRRLSTLLEVSQALSGVLNLKAALQSVLDLLERRHQVAGGTVFLLDADTRELHVEATVGTRLGAQRARVRPGDGITERVIDTGKPVVVPRASQEPALAAAAGERARGRELTYHRRADRRRAAARRAPSRWCSPSSRIATTSARSSSTASSPR